MLVRMWRIREALRAVGGKGNERNHFGKSYSSPLEHQK